MRSLPKGCCVDYMVNGTQMQNAIIQIQLVRQANQPRHRAHQRCFALVENDKVSAGSLVIKLLQHQDLRTPPPSPHQASSWAAAAPPSRV